MLEFFDVAINDAARVKIDQPAVRGVNLAAHFLLPFGNWRSIFTTPVFFWVPIE